MSTKYRVGIFWLSIPILLGWGVYTYANSYPTKYANPPIITVPLYGGAFTTPQAAQQSNDVFYEILAELKAIRIAQDANLVEMQKLRALAEAPIPLQGDPTQQQPQVLNHIGVMQAKCLRCHSITDADKKGGGFKMFSLTGNLETFSPNQSVKIYRMVSTGEMPPKDSGSSLNDIERKLLLDWVEGK